MRTFTINDLFLVYCHYEFWADVSQICLELITLYLKIVSKILNIAEVIEFIENIHLYRLKLLWENLNVLNLKFLGDCKPAIFPPRF